MRRDLAQGTVRLAESLGVGIQTITTLAECAGLTCDREWQSLLDAASDGLRLIGEGGAGWLFQPIFMARIGAPPARSRVVIGAICPKAGYP